MDNITFTTEQKEQLKNNVRAIERYIEENVVPYIKGDVHLEFGSKYRDHGTGIQTSEYILYISSEKWRYCAGWNVYKDVYVGLAKFFGPAVILEERLPSDQYALLREWSSLKQRLEHVVDKQRTDAAFIANFKV